MTGHQMSIFDITTARARRDRAITTVAGHMDPVWNKAALWAIRTCAYTLPEFTTDHVWAELDDINIAGPAEPRAMGAVIKQAVTGGLIIPTDRVQTSARPECHARPCRVWKSTAYWPDPCRPGS